MKEQIAELHKLATLCEEQGWGEAASKANLAAARLDTLIEQGKPPAAWQEDELASLTKGIESAKETTDKAGAEAACEVLALAASSAVEITQLRETTAEKMKHWNEQMEDAKEKVSRAKKNAEQSIRDKIRRLGEVAEHNCRAELQDVREGAQTAQRVNEDWERLQEDSARWRREVDDLMTKLRKHEEDAQGLVKLAATSGIAGAFTRKEKEIAKDWMGRWVWPVIGLAAAFSAVILVWALASQATTATSWEQIAAGFLYRGVAVVFLGGIALFAGKQHLQWHRNRESYGHKWAVTASMKAFADELDQQGEGSEEKKAFIRGVCSVVCEHPAVAGRNPREEKKA